MSDKTRKYIFYALGEILLVVIGILIALQVNNWNEERLEREEAAKLIQRLENSIEDRFDRYGFLLRPYVLRDSMFYQIINKDPDYEVSTYNPISFVDFTEFYWDDNFDTILEQERIFPDKYDPVLSNIRQLKSVRESLLIPEAADLRFLEQKNLELLTEYGWQFKYDAASNEKRKDYYFGDVPYRNRLQVFHRAQSSFAGQTARFQMLQLMILARIKLLDEKNGIEELLHQWKSYGLVRLNPQPCEGEIQPPDDIHNFLYWNIILNQSDEALDIYWSEDAEAELELGPGEIILQSNPSENRVISIGNDNGCIASYNSSMNGYILMEN